MFIIACFATVDGRLLVAENGQRCSLQVSLALKGVLLLQSPPGQLDRFGMVAIWIHGASCRQANGTDVKVVAAKNTQIVTGACTYKLLHSYFHHLIDLSSFKIATSKYARGFLNLGCLVPCLTLTLNSERPRSSFKSVDPRRTHCLKS